MLPALFAAIMLRSALFDGTTSLSHDVLYWFYPLYSYFADGIRNGILPLWNPFSHGGEPLLAHYLQLRLLDPVSIAVSSIGGLITSDVTFIVAWDRFARGLIAALGTHLLLRQWVRHPVTRAILAISSVLSPILINGFHQNGIPDQYYLAPFAIRALLQILEGDNRWRWWLMGTLSLGCSLQSYFMTGTLLAISIILVGYAEFRTRRLLLALQSRENWARFLICGCILAAMSGPMIAMFLDRADYHFVARNAPPNWENMLPQGGPIDRDLGLTSKSAEVGVIMPYPMAALTGTFGQYIDLVGFLVPVFHFFSKYSEGTLFIGSFGTLVALYGIFGVRHRMKSVWVLFLAFFILLFLGSRAPVHWVLYQFFPPLWLMRHTHLLAGFILLAMLFFFSIGCDRLFIRRPFWAGKRSAALIALHHPRIIAFVWTLGLAAILFLLAEAPTHGNTIAWLILATASLISANWVSKLEIVRKFLVSHHAVSVLLTIFLGLTVFMGIHALIAIKPVPVSQLNPIHFVLLSALVPAALLTQILRPHCSTLGVVSGLVAVGLTMSIDPWAFLSRIIVLGIFPCAVLFFLQHRGHQVRTVFAAIAAFVVVSDGAWLMLHSDHRWGVPRPEQFFSTRGADPFPDTRHALIDVSNLPDRFEQPIRYSEVLTRQAAAFDTPRSFPGKPISKDVETIVRGERWNTFVTLADYARLVHSGLPPDVLSQIFAINKSIVEFKPVARVTDDFVEEILAMGASTAAQAVSDNAFLDRSTLSNVNPEDLERPGRRMPEAPPELTKRNFDHFRIKFDSPDGGILLVSDAYHSGWQAKINGIETPVHKANGHFKAVIVPSGSIEVDFQFRPLTIRFSIFAFFGAFLIGAAAWLISVFWPGRSAAIHEGRPV